VARKQEPNCIVTTKAAAQSKKGVGQRTVGVGRDVVASVALEVGYGVATGGARLGGGLDEGHRRRVVAASANAAARGQA
jgi:hypothetical protein